MYSILEENKLYHKISQTCQTQLHIFKINFNQTKYTFN